MVSLRLTGSEAQSTEGQAAVLRWWTAVDRLAVVSILALFAVGILLCFAASVPLAARNDLQTFHYVLRQFVFGTIGLFVMLAISTLGVESARRLGSVLFLLALGATLLLPVFGSSYGTGATRWFSLGFASLQPSEFLKPGLIVVSAWLVAGSFDEDGPPGLMLSLALTMFVVALLVLQPDFGQAALVLFGWATVYFTAGVGIVLLIAVGILSVGLGVAAYFSSDHFAGRIDEFLTRFMSVDSGSRTQVDYAIQAIQEGRFFGVGFGEGSVKWYLPDGHTDFIIAVAAEEFGFVLVLVIAALFAAVCVSSMVRLARLPDPFARIAGSGLVATIGMQAFINISVAIRLVPPKGMTLPLISYGGSSMLATGLLLGMLLAFTKNREKASYNAKKRSLVVLTVD